MSWESTVPYYQTINRFIGRRLGGLHSAKVALYSVDFDDIEKLQHAGKWEGPAGSGGRARAVAPAPASCAPRTRAQGRASD
jgi:aspartate/glutamate racemase